MDVLSRGGIYTFAIAICLVLFNLDHLKCDVMCIYDRGMSVGVNVILSLMSVISPPPDLCGLSTRTVVYVGTWGGGGGV